MSDAFGADTSMSIDELAAAIKSINVTKQPSHKLTDVIDIIEHLRTHALALHESNVQASERLAEHQAQLTKREAELALRTKAVDAILKGSEPRKYFWR
jgi:hypothetical protein